MALQRLRAISWDLVILDNGLLGMYGTEVFRLMRGRPDGARPPVIFLTAAAVALHDLGPMRPVFMRKPFDVGELITAMTALLA